MVKKKSGNELQRTRALRTDDVNSLCSVVEMFVTATAWLNDEPPTPDCTRGIVSDLAQLRDTFWRFADADWEPPEPQYSRALVSALAELCEEFRIAELAWELPDSRVLNEVVEAINAVADKLARVDQS